MRRREFIGFLGSGALGSGALAWATAACAQSTQASKTPVIGFLNSVSPAAFKRFVTEFHQGLKEAGYVEGQNVNIEYRWARGDYKQLSELAAELVSLNVDVIATTGGLVSARAAKGATSSIPVLFIAGFDPVKLGLVSSINKPGGNATGFSVYTTELLKKRLEVLRELVPGTTKIGMLLNPNTVIAPKETEDMVAATKALGLELVVLNAATVTDLEAVFASAAAQKVSALLVSADPFFTAQRATLTALAAKHGIPAGYPWREYTLNGGLMSYGPSIKEAYYKIGLYAGRIIKGANPSELPVQLPTKFELVINLKTAKALNLAVSPWLLARTDEVIE
jgi:putative ABC transport system substrate-binding protein